MAKNRNVFQNLTNVLMGIPVKQEPDKKTVSYNINPGSDILFRTDNKQEYDAQLLQMRQQKFLNYQWKKAGYDSAMDNLVGLSNIRLSYRDSDLMDVAEVGSALDTLAEEVCALNPKGKVLNIYSSSKRIKAILEDLFVNRLDAHVILPMIARGTCKYGNQFMLLNIDKDNGVKGWKQLPVYDMERIENNTRYPMMATEADLRSVKNDDTKFIWNGKNNEQIPFQNWQVAHFRLLTDSIFLPYGCSWLNKARRHWRMLSMMEDMMLVYRLERSVERRVFKIYVGNIDEEDVQAYVETVANNMKRAPIIDPLTGQLDLRKNYLDMSADYFIPVRNENAPTPIDTLSGAQNLTAMDDIEFIQNKVLASLRIPKSFLNFQDAQGKGQNLSLLDIRFTRTVNRIQQALLMELNKIAIIHLALLGFEDDLTNFTITMNNPSSQLETLELDNLMKRIQAAQVACSDSNNKIPIVSYHWALREIMRMNDDEIAQILEEIRLEKALAAELDKTTEIIKRTGIFDPVDRIYGQPGAEYSEDDGSNGENGDNFSGGGGATFGDMGIDDLGAPGSDEEGFIEGEEGEVDLGNGADADEGIDNNLNNNGNAFESTLNGLKKMVLNEKEIIENNIKARENKYYQNYLDRLAKEKDDDHYFRKYIDRITKKSHKPVEEKKTLYNKNFLINEELNSTVDELTDFINENNDKD